MLHKIFARIEVLLISWMAALLLTAGCSFPPVNTVPSDELVCTDQIGCVEIAADEPVTIASMVVLSGPNSALGQDMANAVVIAVADYGDIHGHSIEISAEDSLCSAEGGQTAARKVVANPAIAGVLGTACSSAATAALPVVSSAGLTMIAASTTSPSLTDSDQAAGGVWQPGFFRTSHNDLILGQMVAQFAYETLGARTMATVHDGSIYADLNQAATAAAFEELGGTIVHQGAVNVGDQDMRAMLIEIATSTPDVLVYPLFQPEGNLLTAQVREISGLENVELIAGSALFSEDFLPNTGEAAIGMYMTGPRVASARYDELRRKYVETHGGPPTSGYHAHMYDAAFMLLDAISASAQVDAAGNMLIGRQAIRDYLKDLRMFEGLTGSLQCGATGDCATGEALAIYQIQELDLWPPSVVFPDN